jgi:hypothetical protein
MFDPEDGFTELFLTVNRTALRHVLGDATLKNDFDMSIVAISRSAIWHFC